jgi:hypothetical protein
MTVERFGFAFDRPFVPLLALAGVRRSRAEVVLDDTHLRARFGPFRLETPLTNLRSVQVTRGYRWWRAIGPRGSAPTAGRPSGPPRRAGTCICFHEPVPALFGQRMLHPALTVTVTDPEALAARSAAASRSSRNRRADRSVRATDPGAAVTGRRGVRWSRRVTTVQVGCRAAWPSGPRRWP